MADNDSKGDISKDESKGEPTKSDTAKKDISNETDAVKHQTELPRKVFYNFL